MSRREIGIRERDSHRDGRPDIGRSVRYPLHPPPLHRERMRGDSPRNHRMRSVSPPRLHRDRFPGDNRGRNGHRESSPRRRASRSPIRGTRHRVDGDFHNFQARSPDGYRRRSLEPQARRDSSRERRIRSPRLAAHTPPPPPPPRSPRVPMRPVSPRFSLRPASPRLPTRLASPRASLRPVSPRLPMHPVSPQALIRPLSPQGALLPSRMPMRGSSPPASAFSRELDRHAHEAMLASSRNGSILALQSGSSLGPGSTDVHKNQEDESLSSSGMLVPCSIVLEDGTVGTFYSLPPDPLLNPIPSTVENGLGGKLLPPFPDGLTQYSTEPASLRYAGIPVERDYFSAQDQRLSDRTLPSQNQYAAGDRGLPEYSSYHRDRPLSPHQNAFDRPLQSRSPLRNRDSVVNSSSREGYASEMERASRRVNYDKRESAFSTDIPLRDGFSSPPKRRSEEDYRKDSDKDMIGYGRDLKHDEFLRISEEGRMTRYAPPVYDPPRQRGLVRSPEPRDSLRFEPRDANFHRQTRSPLREAPRHDDDYPQRHSAYRSDMRRYPSPDRNTRMSPRRMRPLTPPDVRKNFSYEEERRAWKRKFIEMGGDPFPEQRNSRLHESEFKRREMDGNMHPNDHFRDRRPSGWDRKDGWLERREDALGRLGRRPIRERSRSPRLPRRYPDIDKRQNGFSVKEQPGRLNVDKVTPSQREIQDRDEQKLAPDLPEDSVEFKQQVQRAFLKYAKIVNEDSVQRKKYEEQGKAGTLVCLACGRLSKPFVDTHSLVMHSLQSKKRGLRADHLGLLKAICGVMGWNHDIDPAGGKLYQNISVEEAKANKEDLVLWPPAVVVHNVFGRKITEGQQEGAAESAVKELLKESRARARTHTHSARAMEVLLQRARSFASEAAKKSQDLAKEAAKISQEIAQETAKRSKELATEASKKADQLKAFAGDISLPIPSSSSATAPSSSASSSLSPSSSSAPSEEDLIKYGITPELREFVNGLTLSTFQDFPADGFDSDAKDEAGTSNVRQDLTDWQEQHALHVLKAVPEISRFRYDLCPRHMKEKRFWKIYFTLVRSHVVLYEAPHMVPEDFLGNQHTEKATSATPSANEVAEISMTTISKVVETPEIERTIDDQDLDAYLLGDLDSDGDGDGEDVAFDAEFDQLVNNSALDSDAEEEERHEAKVASSSPTKASEGSSDGELV